MACYGLVLCVFVIVDQRNQSSDVHQMLCSFVPIATLILCLFLFPWAVWRRKSFLYNKVCFTNVFFFVQESCKITVHRWLAGKSLSEFTVHCAFRQCSGPFSFFSFLFFLHLVMLQSGIKMKKHTLSVNPHSVQCLTTKCYQNFLQIYL